MQEDEGRALDGYYSDVVSLFRKEGSAASFEVIVEVYYEGEKGAIDVAPRIASVQVSPE